jgi:hypothetical protein
MDENLHYKGTVDELAELIKEVQRDLDADVEWTILIQKDHVHITAVNGDTRI